MFLNLKWSIHTNNKISKIWYFIFCPTQLIDSFPDMATSETQDTQDFMLRHPGIFEKIMLMIAHGSLEDLDNCRLVCRTWNEIIMNKIWENPTKKWGAIIQSRIERCWDYQEYYPSDKLISKAKFLGKNTDSQYF